MSDHIVDANKKDRCPVHARHNHGCPICARVRADRPSPPLPAPAGSELDCGMSNDVAWCLGLIAREVGTAKAGDEIDRGLILVRRLRETGYLVVPIPTLSGGEPRTRQAR